MRKICIVVIGCLITPLAAQVVTPRVEAYGGFSYLHVDTQDVTNSSLNSLCSDLFVDCPAGTIQLHRNFKGWNGGVKVNATRYLGLKADFSGNYGTPVTISADAKSLLSQAGISLVLPKAHLYSYLFGPEVFVNKGHFKPFAHALFGANRVNTDLSGAAAILGLTGQSYSDTAFAMAFGGGLDIKLTNHLSLRAAEADYLYTKHDFSGGAPGVATHQNNYRASAGVVFQFGGSSSPKSTTRSPRRTLTSRQGTSQAVMAIAAMGVFVGTTARNTGAQVTEVAPNSVAALAGIQPEDVINTRNGVRVATPMELSVALSTIAPGATVRVGYMIRGAWQTETTIILGNR